MPTVEHDGVQSTDLDIEKEGISFHMSIYTRARRLALGVACLGGGLLGIGTALVPATAAAGTLSCVNITGSGSSLQKAAQEKVFTVDFASTLCATKPGVVYTPTGSGKALEEFGNETETLLPAKSGNGTTLDGYVGTDDPPTPVQVNEANKAAGGGDQKELTIPVAVGPVALLLHPPAACEVKATPNVSNTVLDELWQDKYASWDTFLTEAGVSHSGTCTAAVTLVVRTDSSGTSFILKSYLKQIDSGVWSPYANDFPTWPDATTHPSATGGSAVAKQVKETEGTVGYAVAADSHGAEFAAYPNAAKGFFWAEIQNDGGKGTTAKAYADPVSGTNGNCPTGVTPAGQPVSPGNWSGVLLSNPNIAGAPGFVSGQYSLCGFTYDLAWADYGLIGSYGAAAAETGNSVVDFLTYVTGQGQSDLAGGGQFYSALPTPVKKVAQETVAEVNNPTGGGGNNGGGNNGGGGGGTGGGGTTTTPTTTTPTTPSTTPSTTTTTKPAVVVKPLTKAQKLAKALKACKKKSKKQRASCEKQAKKKYGATKSHKKSKKH